MTRVRHAVILVGAAMVLAAAPAAAQTSRSTCADCHFARPDSPAQDHLFNWDRSPHARNSVGCEKCHGGNATTFEPLQAHAGLLTAAHAKSPVNRRNLPATCGACHIGPFVAFHDSRHYQLLESGKAGGPSCSTCHETVGARLLSPKALEARCASCRGPEEVAPRAGRAREARDTYEQLAAIKAQLKLARARIQQVADPARRAVLADVLQQAEVPLTRAVNAGHRFVYGELVESAAVAQTRIEALMQMIDGNVTTR
jgi:hypothetical protein